MTRFAASLAQTGRSKGPRYSDAQIDHFIEAHERFVHRLPKGRRAILRYIQAPGHDLSGRVLTGADLTGANLQRARMVLTCLDLASLHFADLRGVEARGATFAAADMRGASLRHADLSGAVLNDADLSEAALARGETTSGFRLIPRPAEDAAGELSFSVDFTGCSMKRAGLANARLTGANFTGALLTGAVLTGADLSGSRFDDAVLTGASMTGLKIDPDALAKCVMDPSERAIRRAGGLLQRLTDAECWIDTNGAQGCPAVLDGEDLRPLGARLSQRRLTALSAERVCAVGVSFAGSQLQGARFDRSDLRDADFTGADLRGASFRGAKLRHASFKDADLRPLPLTNGAAQEVDLGGADHADDAFASSRRN
ncbi:MAG: pentapeptide repeat-containing protein [Caulobacteraceae bacterium]|nr:pentapeptide repeat-containing protein [Caulobacteraceae bacterium]